jgi:hypothetical protein
VKDRDAGAGVVGQAIEYGAGSTPGMEAKNPTARRRAVLKDLFKDLFLQLKTAAHVRTAVQADLADVAGLAQQICEKRHFGVAVGDELGVQSEPNTDAWPTPDSLRVPDQALGVVVTARM